jgi:ATP-dependent DNA helicase RecQ
LEVLGRALADPAATPGGRCARCTGDPISGDVDRALVAEAQEFLRREPLTVDPRKRDAQNKKIPDDRQLEPGRALSYWGDGGWGGLVRDQAVAGAFSDELVDATVRLVQSWGPQPRPSWVTCVPSGRSTDLVPAFASRVAAALRLPFRDCVTLARDHAPQSEMANTAQQSRNVAGAFAVTSPVPDGPVLLVDDTVDSRWTLTEVGARLREAGADAVLPLVLAQAASD